MGIFSFFRKSATQPASRVTPTFKENVSAFWNWYQANAEVFYATIEDGRCADLADEVIPAVEKWMGGMAWVFGSGEGGNGHSFTISPEGDPHRSFLTEYWLKAAPAIPGWTFYSSRQPATGDLDGHSIKIRGQDFKPNEFWITPEIDLENECVHITAWHPLFEHLDENKQFEILFLWLDEILGERGTSDYIGRISLENTKLKDAFPILELGKYIAEKSSSNDWKSHEPGSVYMGYSMENPTNEFLRSDIFAGTTTHMRLVNEYFNSKGAMEDPLEGTGACFVFLAFDNSCLPEGKEVDARGKIEDALIEILEPTSSGRCLGGATGTENVYIDLLLFDGERSLNQVIETLNLFDLPNGSAIYSFSSRTDTPLHVF